MNYTEDQGQSPGQNTSLISTANRRSKRVMPLRKPPECFTAAQASGLMADVETRFPDWACHVALALFAGIRPVELVKLAQSVAANGTASHFSATAIVLPEDISRGEGREVAITPNLAAWLAKYPPTPERICPKNAHTYVRICKAHGVRSGALRNTAICASFAAGGGFATSALGFGTTEVGVKRHYCRRMSGQDAEAFFAILPRKG